MTKSHLLLGTLLLTTLPIVASAQTVIGTQAAGGRRIEAIADSAARRVVAKVYEGKYSFVRIEEREPGAAINRHPLSISPHALRGLLASATMIEEGKPEPIFNAEQLDEITAPLSVALARALPTQDVSFAVAGLTNSFGMFASRSVTTARVFAQEKSLEIIFGLGRRDFENQMRGTGMLIAFEPGQRAQRVDSNLAINAPETTQRRADWLSIDLQRLELAGAGSTPVAVPGAARPPPLRPRLAAATSTRQRQPHVPVQRRTPRAFSTTYLERFKALQKLRDAGLISEAEFEAKRKSLLGEL